MIIYSESHKKSNVFDNYFDTQLEHENDIYFYEIIHK